MLRKVTILGLALALVLAGTSSVRACGWGGWGFGGYRGGWGGDYGSDCCYGNGWGGYAYGDWGGYSSCYGSGYCGGYYSSPSCYGSSGCCVAPGYATTQYVVPGVSYVSSYVSASPAPVNTAQLNIHMPASAHLFFDAAEDTHRAGADRQFVTPTLDPNSNYQYVLRANWSENGKQMNRTKTVTVHANDVINVDLTQKTN